MKIEIKAIIEVDEMWFGTEKEDLEWFKKVLKDKENTFLQLWSNEIGDEISATNNFKYKIL